MTDRTWFRPESESDARKLMIDCESKRDYEGAALAAITIADYIAVRTAEGAAAYERQARCTPLYIRLRRLSGLRRIVGDNVG